jgi:hypothetical protein
MLTYLVVIDVSIHLPKKFKVQTQYKESFGPRIASLTSVK